jgi:uncharacterized protein YbjT (DUF2867 family)
MQGTRAEVTRMSRARTFVVAGATGRVGGATARHLKRAGHKVVGITHSPSNVQKLESMGITPLVADLRDPSTLIPYLKWTDGFFLVTDPFPGAKKPVTSFDDMDVWVKDEVSQGDGALKAAKAAEVPHVVQSSVTHLGSEAAIEKYGLPVHKTKVTIERRARELGLPHTALLPPWFMDDWVPNPIFLTPWLESGLLKMSVKDDTPLPQIATDDIGRVAAWALQHPDKSIGQAWEIVGEVTTMPAIARTLSEHFHRSILFKEVSGAEDDFPPNRALVRREFTWDVGQWESKFAFRMTTFEEFVKRTPAPTSSILIG